MWWHSALPKLREVWANEEGHVLEGLPKEGQGGDLEDKEEEWESADEEEEEDEEEDDEDEDEEEAERLLSAILQSDGSKFSRNRWVGWVPGILCLLPSACAAAASHSCPFLDLILQRVPGS